MKDLVVRPITQDEVLAGVREDRAQFGPIINAFHSAFYLSRWTHNLTHWMGVPILKNPLDVWIYQELLFATRPTLIIETGTAYGGSALFFAHMLDRVGGESQVISVDLEPHHTLPKHPRLTFLKSDSVAPDMVAFIKGKADRHERVMVILDSDHSEAHVLKELDAYADLVTIGNYLVVEDTHYNDRPVPQSWMGGPGPGPAVDQWVPQHPEFERDLACERFFMTFYPGGWLRRVK